MNSNEDVERLGAASEDVMAKIAVQVTGAFLHFESHIKNTINAHLHKVVMAGLGFVPDSFDTYRIRGTAGSAVVDTVREIAREMVKAHAQEIFDKITAKKSKTRPKVVDAIKKHFSAIYHDALVNEIRRLFEEELKGAQRELEKEISEEVPKNLNLVISPILEGVRKHALAQLAEGRFVDSYGYTREKVIEDSLDLERVVR